MAYRVGPMLGEYRQGPLLGAVAVWAFQKRLPIAPVLPSTQTVLAPFPRGPVSMPTVIAVPISATAPVMPPYEVSPLTATPNPLPAQPAVPTMPGSSPGAPIPGGGGGGGGSVTTPGPAAAAVSATTPEGQPNWILPAAIGAGLLLFMMSRRGGRKSAAATV